MELFTLGEGHYTERDIKEVARHSADMSWKSAREIFVSSPNAMTKAIKKYWASGEFSSKDVVDITETRTNGAVYLRRTVVLFMSNPPKPEQLKEIASSFRSSDYDISVAIRAILLSEQFWAENERGTMVKSPIELTVGTLRSLEIPLRDGSVLSRSNRQLGQHLFDPPNVNGWTGGVS